MKVTIVVCTYNHEKYIAQALESILMQRTNFPFGVVVLDDCSSDGTADIARSFERSSNGLLRVRASAVNKNDMTEMISVLESTSSPYIAFLDGDDFWTSAEKLQNQVNFLESELGCSGCFHNVEKIYEDGSTEDYNPSDQKRYSSIEDLFPGCFIHFGSAMLRKSALVPLPRWLNEIAWGDWALYLLAAHHGTLGYIPEKMSVYRIHKHGFWSGRSELDQLAETSSFYRVLYRNLDPRYRRIIREQMSLQHYFRAFALARQGNLTDAKRSLLKYAFMFPYRTIPLKKLYETWKNLDSIA